MSYQLILIGARRMKLTVLSDTPPDDCDPHEVRLQLHKWRNDSRPRSSYLPYFSLDETGHNLQVCVIGSHHKLTVACSYAGTVASALRRRNVRIIYRNNCSVMRVVSSTVYQGDRMTEHTAERQLPQKGLFKCLCPLSIWFARTFSLVPITAA